MDFNLEKFLKDLELLVNIESGSRDIEGITKIADFFEPKFKELGFITERIELETGPLLIMKSNNSDTNNILMAGHMDTVFPRGTTAEWSFSIDENEKKVFGPGVADMKSGLLIMYEVLKNLDREFLDNYNICVIMNPDEEISSIESKKYIIEESKKSNNAFIFEASRDSGAMVNQRKGLAKYLIKFKGRAAHAGVDPDKGRSAIVALSKTICEIDKLVNLEEGRNLNFGLISGGTGANVVAEFAETQLDLRYVSDEQIEEVEAKLNEEIEKHKLSDVEMTVEKIGERPPLNPSEKSMELVNLFNEVAKSEGIELTWVSTGGGSDGNFTSYYGAATIDAIGAQGGLGHSRDEYLKYDTIEGRVVILTKLIKEMAEKNLI